MELEINKDISKYKVTIYGNITLRIIICVALIIAATLGIRYGLYQYLADTTQLVLIILVDIPIASFAVEEFQMFSMPAEQILRIVLLYLVSPKHSTTVSVDDYKETPKENKMYSFLSKNKFNVPKSVQQFVPLEKFYDSGMASIGNQYSMLYRFSDVDEKTLSDHDKLVLLDKYEGLIGMFTDKADYKISIVNRNVAPEKIYEKMKVPDFEYNPQLSSSINQLMYENIIDRNQIYSDLYLTITIQKNTEKEAQQYFNDLETKLFAKMMEIGSICQRVSLRDRINLYHYLNNPHKEEEKFFDNVKDIKSADIRDYCSPTKWKLHDDYLELSDVYVRTLYLQNVTTGFEDDFWRHLLSIIPDICISSIYISSIPSPEAHQMVNRVVANSGRKLSLYRRDKLKSGDISSYAPPAIIEESQSCEKIYEDINNRKQRLFLCTILLTVTGSSKEALKENTEKILQTASESGCTFNTLFFQQTQGLFSCLPYGIKNPIEVRRVLTTESIAAFVPFSSLSIQSFGAKALWEGDNPVTKKVNSINRANLPNGNGLIFGDSGSGKSVQAKIEIAQRRIKEKDDADIIILDPKGEYSILAQTHGGITVDISVNSDTHINIMEISQDYGQKGNPIKSKISFLQSILFLMCEGEVPRPFVNSIVDRACTPLYKQYAKTKFTGQAPTLQDLYEELKKQTKDREYAEQISLALESYAYGSLNVFAQETNIPEDNGFIVYDMHNLDDSFRTYGLMIMLDQVINRVATNNAKGKYTYIYIDEFHKFFGTPAEDMIMDLWRMGRAMHCFSTGITQNIGEVLRYDNGQDIIHNSEYLKILKCGRMEILEDLSRVVFIPQQLTTYIMGIQNPEAKLNKSSGLIKYANTIIPFESEIPHDSYLYSIINSD